jgi:hypothetical protein
MNSADGDVLAGVRVTTGSTLVITKEPIPRELYSICSVADGSTICASHVYQFGGSSLLSYTIVVQVMVQ